MKKNDILKINDVNNDGYKITSKQDIICDKYILLGTNKLNHNSRLPNKYISGIQKYCKKINPIYNIKLKPINYIGEIKKKSDYVDADEYISQFENLNLHNSFNMNKLNTELNHLKKILMKQNIFLIKTPWDSIWNNSDYSIDFTHDYIYNRYQKLLFERYDIIKNFYILSEQKNRRKYSKNILCMLFVDKLVSYLSVSNYSFCLSKTNGELNIQCNFFNENEKNITLKCFSEIFSERFIYNDKKNIIILYLDKI